MKRKVVSCLAILSLCGIAFFANDAFAKSSNQSNDPNVAALKAARGTPACYMDEKTKDCEKKVTDYGCTVCDDEIVITPDPPINPTVPGDGGTED